MNDRQNIRLELPFETFRQLLISCIDHPEDPALSAVRPFLEDKLEAMARRDLYTQMKTAATEEERAAARREYLDRVGIPEGFRW